MKKSHTTAVLILCSCLILSAAGFTAPSHGHHNSGENHHNSYCYDNRQSDNCPTDNCPADNCPAETCPADNCPADNCPADNCPADTCPADTCPADTCPADNCPAETCPAEICPTDILRNSGRENANRSNGNAPKDNSRTDAVTLASAKKKALADAGVLSKDAVFTKAKSEYDDGVKIYEIEFRAGSAEYEYEIRASDGKILEKSSEGVKTAAAKSKKAAKITLKEAKKIALADAGVSEKELSRYKGKFGSDGGVRVCEIEFTSGDTEYEYKIDAENGEILSAEAEKK